jgi:hypothetical protein
VPMFSADAVADPITGPVPAIRGLVSLLDGGSHVIDVPLAEASGCPCSSQTLHRHHSQADARRAGPVLADEFHRRGWMPV